MVRECWREKSAGEGNVWSGKWAEGVQMSRYRPNHRKKCIKSRKLWAAEEGMDLYRPLKNINLYKIIIK